MHSFTSILRSLRNLTVNVFHPFELLPTAFDEGRFDWDPDLDDAYFAIGLYQYYADVAPAAAKVLRFLLLLPGGDKTEGLARMNRART